VGLIDNIKSFSEKEKLGAEKNELLQSFLAKGFPTIKEEDWKYTSLKKIVANDFSVEGNGTTISENDIEKYTLGFEHKIIFLAGVLISKPNIEGVSISDFSDFETKNTDAISGLNSALAKKGFTIKVKSNTIVESPIEILFFSNTKNDNFIQHRNKIVVGDNAQIKFVERIQNLSDAKCFVNHFTQISIGENANIEYNKIQDNSKNSILIDNMNIYQLQDANAIVNTLIFGGAFTRNTLNFEQNGSNCDSNMNGVSILDKNQFADNHTFVDHKQPYCRSNEMYKGVYLGNSKGVFNGKIMVRPDAQKIDAFQSNNNLLLSENATIDSKPQLEIYADDVKCSHGCTIGQLDDNALFYMRSRGIRKKEAGAVLTYAFASEAVNNMSIPEVKKMAQKLIAEKLNVDLDFNL
jgi:Fe-S cluster assembly protein SufD